MDNKKDISIHERIIHYIEKNYNDGTQIKERVFVKEPLKVKKEKGLISFRYYDHKRIEFRVSDSLSVSNDYVPINYSNYYYFGMRKTLEDLEKEYEIMSHFDSEVHRNIKKTMEEMVEQDRNDVILDYSINPFNPIKIFPNEKDLTIDEYKKSVRKDNSKVLKK